MVGSSSSYNYNKNLVGSSYDRLKELEEFDNTQLGVKGLADSKIRRILRIFEFSMDSMYDLKEIDTQHLIPIIDLAAPHHEVVNSIRKASAKLGFFQVVNHGIPLGLGDCVIKSIKDFHELVDSFDKKWWYHQDSRMNYERGAYYYSNIDLFNSKAAYWQDMLQIRLSPLARMLPPICGPQVLQWKQEMEQIANRLMGYLSEGLGLSENILKGDSYLGRACLLVNYYPYYPEPHRTLRYHSHSDPGMITIMVYSQEAGLQVRYGNKWINFKPLRGALVVKIGDLLQIISKDEYESGVHRILANPFPEARTSVDVTFSQGDPDNVFGPLRELVSATKTPLYKPFQFSNYINTFFKNEVLSKGMIKHYRM